MFCVDLRTNSDYFPIQHKITGFYNQDGECLLHGTDWGLKYSDVYMLKKTYYINNNLMSVYICKEGMLLTNQITNGLKFED